jgi:hypothetical protein
MSLRLAIHRSREDGKAQAQAKRPPLIGAASLQFSQISNSSVRKEKTISRKGAKRRREENRQASRNSFAPSSLRLCAFAGNLSFLFLKLNLDSQITLISKPV